MAAYYNEFKPEAAHMLRQLIRDGLIAAGDVDERSITEVQADDIKNYTQCHFFAGIGGWPVGLRLAGWPDDKPVWTGSCPCQPFSPAGEGKAQSDERHLWPHWYRLIAESKPAIIFGEQVEKAIAYGWLDDVFHDLEKQNYACAAAVLPACSVGKPHKRDRLWFVADSDITSSEGTRKSSGIHAQHAINDSDDKTVEWLQCPDGKARPVESRICLLADGILGRTPILHALGNAIVPQVAAAFIAAYQECRA